MKTNRAVLIVLALASLTAIGARPTAAEIYRPWCVQYQGSRGGATNCGFISFEQCMMTATPGSGGHCVQNPWYLQYGSGGQRTDTTGRRDRTRPY
jgi:hypothetical protein